MCCLLLCLCLSHSATAQQEELSFKQAQEAFGGLKIITYKKYSLSLSEKSKSVLDEIIKRISENPGIIQENVLILQVFTCEQELRVKPYIGVVRAKNVIDYLEARLGLARRKCLILDDGPNPYDRDCRVGSGMNIYLQRGV